METPVFSRLINPKRINQKRIHLIIIAAIALLTGCAYYLYFRLGLTTPVNDPTNGSLPSLVHMLVLTWLALALTGIKRGIAIASALLAISICAEWLMGYSTITDTTMLIAGFVAAATTGSIHLRSVPENSYIANPVLCGAGLVICSLAFITGTTCTGYNCGNDYETYEPVYLGYDELRRSITVSDPRPLTDISRLYIYEDSILLNSKNQGVHILDNTDPTNPRNVAFIEIPGNTEISIRDNYLYVDSYIDLVTLSISNIDNVTEIARQQEIFQYDAYQNIPDDIYLGFIDESKGVVVNYERTN